MSDAAKFVLIPFNHDGTVEFSTIFFMDPVIMDNETLERLGIPRAISIEDLTLVHVRKLTAMHETYANQIDADENGAATDGGYLNSIAGAFVVHRDTVLFADRLGNYLNERDEAGEAGRDLRCMATYAYLALHATRIVGEHPDLKPPLFGTVYRDVQALDAIARKLREYGTGTLPLREHENKAPFITGTLNTLIEITEIVGSTDRNVDHE